jgi:hypothetical protein
MGFADFSSREGYINKRGVEMRHTAFKVVVFFSIITAIRITPANATNLGTVNLQGHNNAFSDQGKLWGGGLNGSNYYTGICSWTNTGGTDLGTQVPNWGFCIELTQGAYNGLQNVIPLNEAPLPSLYGSPMGVTKANYVRELWGRDFDPSWATGADTQMAEAFNVALYEIIYETDTAWDVTSGAGFRSGNIEQAVLANLWLNQLNGDAAHFAKNLVATSTLDGQDFLIQVPDPATLLILAAGTVAALRRRTR